MTRELESLKSEMPVGTYEILNGFLAGANIARCDYDSSRRVATFQFGTQELGEREPVQLANVDLYSVMRYLYHTLATESSHPMFESGVKMTATLMVQIGGESIPMWFVTIPANGGVVWILGRKGPGFDALVEREIQRVENVVLGKNALDSFARWCAENEPFLALGQKHGYRIAISPDLRDALERRLDPVVAARINAFLSDVKA